MKLIAAVDKNWGIGYQNKLLVSIPADMKNFQMLTTGQVVVMGRKTLQSLPGGLPLAQRTNIILSGDEHYSVKKAEVVHSVEETLEVLKNYEEKDVYIIGGESIYRAFLPYVEEAIITYIDYAYHTDTYMENLDESPEWELCEESEEQTYFNLEYYYRTYRRIR